MQQFKLKQAIFTPFLEKLKEGGGGVLLLGLKGWPAERNENWGMKTGEGKNWGENWGENWGAE